MGRKGAGRCESPQHHLTARAAGATHRAHTAIDASETQLVRLATAEEAIFAQAVGDRGADRVNLEEEPGTGDAGQAPAVVARLCAGEAQVVKAGHGLLFALEHVDAQP